MSANKLQKSLQQFPANDPLELVEMDILGHYWKLKTAISYYL